MSGSKGDKPVTMNELGVTLEKFISPIYTRLDRLENDVDEVKRIQLRMENKMDEQIKTLHDRDDIHDKKLKEHDKRINRLEKVI